MKSWNYAFSICLLSLVIPSVLLATEVSGTVSGTWSPNQNPYNVIGEIVVPSSQSLLIEPGVQVVFQGHYALTVNADACLRALGTEDSLILFTALDTVAGGRGIRFNNAQDSSQLSYCQIEYCRATYLYPGSSSGGGIYVFQCNPIISNCLIRNCSAADFGGGIYYLASGDSPLIENCTLDSCSASGSGGGLFLGGVAANALIRGNRLMNCLAYTGGGMYSNLANTLIENCQITGNTVICNSFGGGIYIAGSHNTLSNCLLAQNSAVNSGGGGGGLYCSGDEAKILNTTITDNYGIGGAYINSGTTGVVMKNCIIWGNYWGSDPMAIVGSNLAVTYSDIQGGWSGFGNFNADPLFITQAGEEYYLSQIAAGQIQQSPCVDAGDSLCSLIGTTRTDGVQDLGIVDLGYHYACFGSLEPPSNFSLLAPPDLSQTTDPRPIFDWEDSFDPDGGFITYKLWYDTTGSFTASVVIADLGVSTWQSGSDLQPDTYWWTVYAFDDEGDSTPSTQVWSFTINPPTLPPPVEITLTPINPPIELPASGGSFNFNATLTNTTPTLQAFAVWVMLQLPNGSWYNTPLLGPLSLQLPDSASLTRLRTQFIPGYAPAGTYLYEGRVGTYPDSIWDSSNFTFTKLPTGNDLWIGDWNNIGEDFEQALFLASSTPETLPPSVAPNPFNPQTKISYELRNTQQVNLQVFDLAGRLVATLAEGRQEAGNHQAVFDGSQLASGIYVYYLQAGMETSSGRMLLVK